MNWHALLHGWPTLAALLPLLFGPLSFALLLACIVVLTLFVVAKDQHLNHLLPKDVRKWVDNPVLHGIVKYCAERTDLANEAKRAEAVRRIDGFFRQRGIDLPDRYLNMLLELLVHKLKEDGIL